MVKLKNNSLVWKQFVLILTFLLLLSCNSKHYFITKIEGEKISIDKSNKDSTAIVNQIENFVKPYRDHIDADLSKVLSFSPETLDKSKGQWQTNIGNFLADVALQKCNPIFYKQENQNIDICLFNHGGIRSIIPKGNVTARNAFEVMPFENSAIVVALNENQILEIIKYFILEKKPHPLNGLTFTIDAMENPKNILINGKPLDRNKKYFVLTSDYLANGGDNMKFFTESNEKYDLNYKLRNILIDYFKENDTLKINHDIRIVKE
jgi:2',3'-cyclic-nucleotide 2'-phosphodiesterase (5'-nucleotidase family)